MTQFQAKGARFARFRIDATTFGLVPVAFFSVPFDVRWMEIDVNDVDGGIFLYFDNTTTPGIHTPSLTGLPQPQLQMSIPLSACELKLLNGTAINIANDTGVSPTGEVIVNVAG